MSNLSLENYKWVQYSNPRSIPCPPLYAVFVSTGSVMIEKKGRGRGKKQVEHHYTIYQCMEKMEWIPWDVLSNASLNALIEAIYKVYIASKSLSHSLLSPDKMLSYFISHCLKYLSNNNYNVKILISYQLLTQLYYNYGLDVDGCCPYLPSIIKNNHQIYKEDVNKYFRIQPIDIDEKAYEEKKNNNSTNTNDDTMNKYVLLDDNEYAQNFSKTVFENSNANSNTNTNSNNENVNIGEMKCAPLNDNHITNYEFFLVEDKRNKKNKNKNKNQSNDRKLQKHKKKQVLKKYINSNYYVLEIKQSGLGTLIFKIKSQSECKDPYINLLIGGDGGEEFHSRIGVLKVCDVNELLQEVNQCYEAQINVNECSKFTIGVYPHTFRRIPGTNIGLVVFDSYAGDITDINGNLFKLARQLSANTYKRFVFSIMFVVVIAVNYLYSLCRFHNDIKPPNIFFRRNENRQSNYHLGIDIVLGDHGQGVVSNEERNITLRNDNCIGTEYYTPELLSTNFRYEYVQIAQIGLTAFHLNEGYGIKYDCSTSDNNSDFHSIGSSASDNNEYDNDENDILDEGKQMLFGNMNAEQKLLWLRDNINLNFGITDIDKLIGKFYIETICNKDVKQLNMIDVLLHNIFYIKWDNNELSIAEEFIQNHNCLDLNNSIYRLIVEKAKYFKHE